MLLTGVFANEVGLNLRNHHNFSLPVLDMIIVGIFTFGGSFLIFKLTSMITQLRVSKEEERIGLDISQHAETLEIV